MKKARGKAAAKHQAAKAAAKAAANSVAQETVEVKEEAVVQTETVAKEAVAQTETVAEETVAQNETIVTEVIAETIQEKIDMKKEPKTEIVVQYRHYEADMEQIVERVKENFEVKGNRGVEIEKIQVYVKPEDFTAYYVINDGFAGKVNLF